MTEETPSAPDTVEVPGTLVLFGFDPEPVRVRLRPRSRRWRLLGAGRTVAVALVLTPVAGLVPPHAPWILGVLGVGGFLAKRRLDEHFTVVGIAGACPKCGATLSVAEGRLRSPHPVPCEQCHHEGSVKVDPDVLAEARARE